MTTLPAHRIKPVTCPECGEVIPVKMTRNKGAIYRQRMYALARHVNARHSEAVA